MEYRRLGRTELDVSVVGVGTWQFGGEWGRDFTQREVDAIMGRARELGINLVDTAECYGDHLSESLVGKAIAGRRDEWVVATKFGHRFDGRFKRQELWSAEEVVAQLERSLRALGTDHVDLYQFHSGSDDQFDQDTLWAALRNQVEAGKIRHLGVSIASQEDPRQAERARAVGVRAMQVHYNRLERQPEEAILPVCQREDLGVLVRTPLALGLLSGKYAAGTRFTDESDVRSQVSSEMLGSQLEEVEAIRANELPEGVPMATWALAWTLRHPAVTAVIPGCKSPEQLEGNAAAAALDLTSRA